MNIIEIGKLNDDEAREYLERLRWPNGPVCPHCGSQDATRLHGKAHRPGTIQCNGCREQYTVTVGSVMESSKIPLVKWIMAFHLICSSKKGISALQLKRELQLGSYRTAWFLAHRVRHAMAGEPMQELLKGDVQCDEAYVGGKPRPSNNPECKVKAKRGRGTKKAPVMVLVERHGRARIMPLERVDGKHLKRAIRENVDRSATIMTDEWSAYSGIGREFDGGHEVVNHGRKQYSRKRKDGKSVNTNTAESFFALLKRGHYGVFHQLSKRHLHRYCAEFGFRWNHRKVSDAERTEAAIRQAEGRRLTYETPAEVRDVP